MSREPYQKLPLSFSQQLQQLIDRGMQVDDRKEALRSLELVSYYRLSGYWFLFRRRDSRAVMLDDFEANTRFEEVVRLYEFDRKLRSLLMDAIQRVEIAVRTKMAYHFGHAYGAFGHLESRNFHPRFNHQDWLSKLITETERSKEAFIEHYQNKYHGFPELPIWMATEIMSMGSLSFFYKGLLNQHNIGVEDKKAISSQFGLHHNRLGDWLHALTYIRNVCAHHARMWNRELAIRPDRTRDPLWNPPVTPRNDRIFYILLMLRYLLRSIGWGDAWHEEISALLEPISQSRRYRAAMGIPEKWKEHPIWK